MTRVTFDFEPDEPDDDDSTGMSEAEYLRLSEQLAELGATNIKIEKT